MVPHRQNYDQGGRITTWEPTRKRDYDLCLRLLERRLLPCDNLCRCTHSGAIDIANINQLEYNWQRPWTSNVTREAHVCMHLCTYSRKNTLYKPPAELRPDCSELLIIIAVNIIGIIIYFRDPSINISTTNIKCIIPKAYLSSEVSSSVISFQRCTRPRNWESSEQQQQQHVGQHTDDDTPCWKYRTRWGVIVG